VKRNLLKSFFSSGLQAFAVQVLALVFFYVISIYLPKETFGVISWVNALAVMLTMILSFGLDQVVVRRIAASGKTSWPAAAYFIHALVSSMLALMILFVINLLTEEERLNYLPWFFIAQSLIYIGSSLKQFLNARQQFAPYGVIAVISNICKVGLSFVMIRQNILSVKTVFIILIACGFLELIGLLFYVLKQTDFKFHFKVKAYKKLLKEALPQYVSVLFDTSLSRIDWILLGIISTDVIMADYSFAYRAFEVARLPIAIVAPIILARFAKMLSFGKLDEGKEEVVRHIFVLEMFLAVMIPLVLNIIWSPVVDFISKGKYGSDNAEEFLILSICIPLQFIINLLWTICFASKKYKQSSMVAIYTAVCNLVLNLCLIPLWGGIGAGIAFLISTIIQFLGYYRIAIKSIMKVSILPVVYFLCIGIVSYVLAIKVTENMFLQLLIAFPVYILLSVLLRQVTRKHIDTVKLFISR
jgi:O-antigen/teichoic acid export membrane protein